MKMPKMQGRMTWNSGTSVRVSVDGNVCVLVAVVVRRICAVEALVVFATSGSFVHASVMVVSSQTWSSVLL
jgi:hypothetical protein